jgi:hypothetical protein
MSITPDTSGRSARGRFKHGSNLSENLRHPRVTSHWKSTLNPIRTRHEPPPLAYALVSCRDVDADRRAGRPVAGISKAVTRGKTFCISLSQNLPSHREQTLTGAESMAVAAPATTVAKAPRPLTP